MKKARAILDPESLKVTMSVEDGREVTMNLNAFMFNNIMNKTNKLMRKVLKIFLIILIVLQKYFLMLIVNKF